MSVHLIFFAHNENFINTRMCLHYASVKMYSGDGAQEKGLGVIFDWFELLVLMQIMHTVATCIVQPVPLFADVQW